jgi:hypothetical protein
VVVQDVHTGQILALAIRPTFNPNHFRHTTPGAAAQPRGQRRLRAGLDLQAGHLFGGAGPACGQARRHDRLPGRQDHACRPRDSRQPGRALRRGSGPSGAGGRATWPPSSWRSRSAPITSINTFATSASARAPARTARRNPRPAAPVKRWGGSSIGSIAIGQEVAVTPLQLVTMVSTIANGGVYLPPHVLMPGQVDRQPPKVCAAAAPQASPSSPAAICPIRCPRRASRVLSTMTAAEMRKMMEGVVLFGTGKEAQLNGYSSGGKTGTAQKIDPATHTLLEDDAHRFVRRLCAGQQSGHRRGRGHGRRPRAQYYGASVSAPVFCRGGAAGARISRRAARHRSAPQPAGAPPTTATVLVAGAKTLRVPSLLGLPVRKVIEQAAAAGLEVEITGSGTVREQAPAPGTMVAPGTRIVVRCGR